MPTPTKLAEARSALKAIQDYDASILARRSDLGALSFDDAVPIASELIAMFNRLALAALDDFPDSVLDRVQARSASVIAILKSMEGFTLKGNANPTKEQETLIAQLRTQIDAVFNELHPYISYSLHRVADFGRLEVDSRDAVARIQRQADENAQELAKIRDEAETTLNAVRDLAAKGGVSAQGVFFKNEADAHETAANAWRKATFWAGGVLFVLAIATLFLHKHGFFAPSNVYDTVQLALSKVLIVGVAAYALFFCARNYMGHRHNVVINRHRQNALFTYTALTEGAADPGHRSAVLLQAASAIYSPQATGYAQAEGEGGATKSAIEIGLKAATASAAKSA